LGSLHPVEEQDMGLFLQSWPRRTTVDHDVLLMTSALRAMPLPALSEVGVLDIFCKDAVLSMKRSFFKAIALQALLAGRGYALVNFYAFAST